MGAGVVDVSDPVRVTRARPATAVAGLGALAAASVVLGLLGIGTGEGPLGPPPGYSTGASRDVGDDFTDGGTVLTNDSWFAAHVEDIRPLPVDGASTGLAITGVHVAPLSGTSVGGRLPAAGYTIPAGRRVGRAGSEAEVLVSVRVTKPGVWTYRGYEVTYRSALVRHRMVAAVTLQACTPSGGACLSRLP